MPITDFAQLTAAGVEKVKKILSGRAKNFPQQHPELKKQTLKEQPRKAKK